MVVGANDLDTSMLANGINTCDNAYKEAGQTRVNTLKSLRQAWKDFEGYKS
jgi:hypothetical protein